MSLRWFSGATIPGQVLSGVIGAVLGTVLGAAAVAILGYVLSQLAGDWLIHQLGGTTRADVEEIARNTTGPGPIRGGSTWEKDTAENGQPFDPSCEYRIRVLTASSSTKPDYFPNPTPLADGPPQTIYVTWVKPAALLQPWKAGWFIVSSQNRQKLPMPDSNSAADVVVERRCISH